MLARIWEAAFLVGSVYCLGAADLDPRLSVIVALLVVVLVTAYESRQRQRMLKANLLNATGTADQLMASLPQNILDVLPSWVTFPDTERADWLNTFLKKYWPYLNAATEDTMIWCLNPIFARLVKGTPIKKLAFDRFSLGGTPIQVTGVRCHGRGSHAEIVLDLDVRLAGRPDILLDVGLNTVAHVPVMLSELQLVGTLRLVFAPLVVDWPCFGGLSIGFVKQPLVDVRLAVATNAFDIMSVPGVSESLQSIICWSLGSYFTWPNFLPVRILDCEMDTDYALTMGIAGVLELEIVGASGLKRPPLGSSLAHAPSSIGDVYGGLMSAVAAVSSIKPFVSAQLRGADQHTPTLRSTAPPCAWAHVLDLIVDHPDSDVVGLKVWDDQINNAILGTCNLDVRDVVRSARGFLDTRLSLQGGAAGMQLHVRAQWRPFPKDPLAPPPEDENDITPAAAAFDDEELRLARASLRVGRPVPPAVGLLIVELHSASELLALDYGGTSDPYVKLSVGDAKQRSKVMTRTTEPRWEEKFRFAVRDAALDKLTLRLFDRDMVGDDDPLGSLTLPLSELSRVPKTQQTYKLQEVSQGEVSLTIHWRRLCDDVGLTSSLPPDAKIVPPSPLKPTPKATRRSGSSRPGQSPATTGPQAAQ